MKDRELLFQQVMREYNMKFVYPSITKMTQDEMRIKAYEEALQRWTQPSADKQVQNLQESDKQPHDLHESEDDVLGQKRNKFATPKARRARGKK